VDFVTSSVCGNIFWRLDIFYIFPVIFFYFVTLTLGRTWHGPIAGEIE